MSDKLDQILIDILDLDPDEMSDALTPEDVDLWDSLNHLKLVTAMEAAFAVTFTMEEVQSITSIGGLRELLSEKV